MEIVYAPALKNNINSYIGDNLLCGFDIQVIESVLEIGGGGG